MYNGFVATHRIGHMMYGCARTSCAQVLELPQSHYGDSREGTLIVFMIAYTLRPSCFCEI